MQFQPWEEKNIAQGCQFFRAFIRSLACPARSFCSRGVPGKIVPCFTSPRLSPGPGTRAELKKLLSLPGWMEGLASNACLFKKESSGRPQPPHSDSYHPVMMCRISRENISLNSQPRGVKGAFQTSLTTHFTLYLSRTAGILNPCLSGANELLGQVLFRQKGLSPSLLLFLKRTATTTSNCTL